MTSDTELPTDEEELEEAEPTTTTTTTEPAIEPEQLSLFNDTPTVRAQMTDADVDKQLLFIEGIRERRLKVVRIHEQAVAARKEATSVAALVKLQKQSDLLYAEVKKLDALMDKIEKRALTVRALILEATS